MSRAVVGLTILTLLALSLPLHASFHPDAMIVPSRHIGPFHLGMSERAVRAQRRTAPCDVHAVYADGKVNRLETNCGGAYHTAEHIQVGEGPTRMLLAFGMPERRTASDFAGIRGEWLHYTRAGIAFRLVYGGSGVETALIQAIAVFKGSGPFQVRRPVPILPPAMPPTLPPEQTPGVGE